MGKRPPKNANPGGGKKKKRSRVQRDYDEGLDDEVVEQHIPSGPRRARSTQKKVEASIATWERVKEAQFHQQQRARFAKPPPPEKPPAPPRKSATVMDTSYFIPMMVSAGVFFAGYAWLKHVKKKREARRQRQGKGG